MSNGFKGVGEEDSLAGVSLEWGSREGTMQNERRFSDSENTVT